MSLIDTKEAPRFDESKIKMRDLVRAQYHTWPEPRNGIVLSVSADIATVIFLPAIHQAVCYFHIKADEVLAGKWRITLVSFSDDENDEMTVRSEHIAAEYARTNAAAEDGVDTSSPAVQSDDNEPVGYLWQ